MRSFTKVPLGPLLAGLALASGCQVTVGSLATDDGGSVSSSTGGVRADGRAGSATGNGGNGVGSGVGSGGGVGAGGRGGAGPTAGTGGGSGPVTGVGGNGIITGAGGGIVGGGPSQWSGASFPWEVFTGTVPDVAPAVAPGSTYYADTVNGNDAWDGTSFTFVSGTKGPKKTVSGALAIAALKAGDVILLGGGIYRERPTFKKGGAAGNPITLGSYGHNTGAPIIDGGVKPGTWTRYTAQGQTTVWQTPTSALPKIGGTGAFPVLSVYVNGPNGESALRETNHGQLEACGTMPPTETQVNISDQSSKWYHDTTAKILYADFGGSLGTGDPNAADVSIVYKSHDINTEVLLDLGVSYHRFVGLTLRAGSWSGAYSQSPGLSFEHCDVKFNGGAGISLGSGATVAFTRMWMNVLDNWPRFNNGNTGGGWPSALGFYAASNSTSIGNVIYQNGGEGLIFYGTVGTTVSSNDLVKNNVIFDNFSVNLYFDNTQGVTADANFVYDHPFIAGQTFDNLLETSTCYHDDYGRRLYAINLALADEPPSSSDGKAHLANITVTNNIFAGAERGFLDYYDGTSAADHGLKSCLIANNTWVVSNVPMPGGAGYGWNHQTDPGNDTNSVVENNLIVVQRTGDSFFSASSGVAAGVAVDYNLFSGTWSGTTLASWKTAHPGWDVHSLSADAMLTDVTEFNQTITQKLVYDWSKALPRVGSPVSRAGITQSARFTTDFTGATRATDVFDIGAIARP